MQAIFNAIVKGDIQQVRERIEAKPGLIDAVATGQPKRYTGQSTLQVAVRSEQYSVARLLLELGADPNFIEAPGADWAAPVVQDATVAAVKRSRWLRPATFVPPITDWRMVGDKESADEAFEMLELLLEAGVDVNAFDSYGNSALGRAAGAAQQILPRAENEEGRPLNRELYDDLKRVFDALLAHGADAERIEKNLNMSLREFYQNEPVGKFVTGEAAYNG